jgi:hypothetical protein
MDMDDVRNYLLRLREHLLFGWLILREALRPFGRVAATRGGLRDVLMRRLESVFGLLVDVLPLSLYRKP